MTFKRGEIREKVKEKIRNLICESSKGYSMKDLSRKLGRGEDMIRKVLKELEKEGQISVVTGKSSKSNRKIKIYKCKIFDPPI